MSAPLSDLSHTVSLLARQPGVYKMCNADGDVIYVGKARNLFKRVSSYFNRAHDAKTTAMVAQIASIDTIVTATETAALLLEAELIKSLKPKYNILLKDDKSYPYLQLTTDHPYPRLDFYRGAKKGRGVFFGPYPSASAVRESLAFIQKVFKIRQCSDSFFAHRTRPCLQYQINRCTAPCVNKVGETAYAQQVEQARCFLQGKDKALIAELGQQMQDASEALQFERAALLRDQIAQLRAVQAAATTNASSVNLDCIAVALKAGCAVICVIMVRLGRVLAKRVFFPETIMDLSQEAIAAHYIAQHYLSAGKKLQQGVHIVSDTSLCDRLLLEQALEMHFGHSVKVYDKSSKRYLHWQATAALNARQALEEKWVGQKQAEVRLSKLSNFLQLAEPITHVECFDISHTQGAQTVASCVVFRAIGAAKKEYRRFNISDVTPGDDYGALKQAVGRRYRRLLREGRSLPDCILIDGGKGQLSAVQVVLSQLDLDHITLMAISKGPRRKPGEENIWLRDGVQADYLAPDDPAFQLLQFIRDEAHQFAITSHRRARQKAGAYSSLLEIEGLGPKRRKQLMEYFGGMAALKKASEIDIAKVPGVSDALAEKIYRFLHSR